MNFLEDRLQIFQKFQRLQGLFFKVAGTFFQGAVKNIEDFLRCREVLQELSLRAVRIF